MSSCDRLTAYVRWAAVVTAFLYTAGYSAIGFGLLFSGALWRLLTRRPPLWQSTVLDLPLGVFAAVLVISAAASPYRTLSLGVTLMLLVSGAVYFGTFAQLLHHDPGARTALLRAWALGALPAALVGLAYGVLTHGRAQIPRGVGPNGLGTTLLLGSILGLGLAFRSRGRERAFWLACGFLGLIGLLATASRTSLVGWVAGAAYLMWRELRPQPRRLAAAFVAGLAMVVLGGTLSPQLTARVRTTVSDVSGNRLQIWPTSLRMVIAHPLLGTGFGAFGRAYEQWKSPGMSSEPFAFNLPLNIAVETGLGGLIVVLWVAVAAVGRWLRDGRRVPPGADSMRPLIAALWIGLLVDQLADNTLFSISTSAGLWLLLAMLVVPPAPVREPSAEGSAGSPGPA